GRRAHHPGGAGAEHDRVEVEFGSSHSHPAWFSAALPLYLRPQHEGSATKSHRENTMQCSSIRNRALVALAAAMCATTAAQAPTPAYPSKPIRMIIALAPGGGVDTTGRILGQKLGEMWGQTFVADNRPGAGGAIAADAVARAAPD